MVLAFDALAAAGRAFCREQKCAVTALFAAGRLAKSRRLLQQALVASNMTTLLILVRSQILCLSR